MLTDEEAEEIRTGVKSGLPGPVLSKWVEALLRDRDERVELERKREAGPNVRPSGGTAEG